MTLRRPFCAENTMTRRPCLCTEKILRELFSCKNVLIPPKNLHSCWPREGKGCIPIHCNWLKNHGQPFSTNQKKTKIHRYHMITYDSYNRSLGSIKMVQRSHHYCFDFRGFGRNKHRNTPRGKPLISRVLKWKKLSNERSDRCNEEAKIDFTYFKPGFQMISTIACARLSDSIEGTY